MDFTNNQPSAKRVLLPLEPVFSNKSDPSLIVEPPDNDLRSDNRQAQTSLSGSVSRRDQSKSKHKNKKRRRRRSSSTSSSSRTASSVSHKGSRRSKRSKHSHKKRRRRFTSSSSFSSLSDNQSHDHGRYKRSRHTPQAAQNSSFLQPAEIMNVQTIPPEQTLQRSTKDSGLDSEIETWSFDKAINENFRLLPPDLCPRPTEEHTPAKPLSGIEHLMESPLLVFPQSKLVENTARFFQNKIDTEKCGRDWICSQNLVSSLIQTKFYRSQNQYFPTDNIPPLESDASLVDLSNKGEWSIPMKNFEIWEKRARKPILFCCMYAAVDNVRASSLKNAGSRS